jgi:hypothetical protein
MPANRKLKPYLKSHLGRTFALRKVVLIPTYADAKGRNAGLVNSIEDLGEAVMVIDETNTRVCIIKASGGTTWIPKYYLLKEVKSEIYHRYDTVNEALDDLSDVSKKLRNSENKELAKVIENVMVNLREIADTELRVIRGNK